MSDKENVKSIIDDNDKSKKPKKDTEKNTDKKPLSDEVKQRIAGLAVIGVITVGLCITGLVGKFSGDSIPTASVSSSVSSLADEESSVADSSSVNSVEESLQEDESSATDAEESSQPCESADESSQQDTDDSQSGDTSADSEQPNVEDSSKAESSQPDKPQTAKPSTTDKPKTEPAKTDPPKTDPPKTDPPKTDPPKTDPPKTDPPAPSGGLSANCSVTNSWETNGEKFFQIGIIINNGTSSDKNGWTLSITVPNGTSIDSSWNGNFSVNGSTITITPVDFNSVIPAGSNRSDVGLIVKSPSEFTPTASVS